MLIFISLISISVFIYLIVLLNAERSDNKKLKLENIQLKNEIITFNFLLNENDKLEEENAILWSWIPSSLKSKVQEEINKLDCEETEQK